MSKTAAMRVTVYFDPALHRALTLNAADTDRSISDLVNEAVRDALAEDAGDLEALEARAAEPDFSFAKVAKDLKRRRKL